VSVVESIALSLGAGWASGVNLYAVVFTLGILGATNAINLPPELQLVTEPAVIVIAGAMYFIEFFADKVPGLDSTWDALHTFIRIPAGAVLASSAIGDVSPAAELAAGLVGGSLAAGAHATKAGSRLLINTSPEPFSNFFVSVLEDIAVVTGVLASLYHPEIFLIVLVLIVLLMIKLLPMLWRGVKGIFQTLGGLFSRKKVNVQVP